MKKRALIVIIRWFSTSPVRINLCESVRKNRNVKCGDFIKDLAPLCLRKTDVVSGQCLSQVVIATFLQVQSTVIRFFQTWLALNHDFKVKFCWQNCNSSSLGPWVFNYQNHCETRILLAIKLKKMHRGVRTFVWQQINTSCKIG